MNDDRTSTSGSAADFHAGEPRRGFLTKFAAVVLGGIITLFPAAAGLAVFLDPLRMRKAKNAEEGQKEGFILVEQVDALTVGLPRRVEVIADRTDAWNYFPNEPIGAVYLLLREDGSVGAFNVVCPHAGCSVDFVPDRQIYQCPCHDSSFAMDGTIANKNSPSARPLDTLEVDSEMLAQGEIWVRYQKFRAGTAEKIVEA